MRVKGSINSGGICGSSLWLPEIVRGAISTCSVRPDVSMHQDALLWGPPMTPGSLAAGSFPETFVNLLSRMWEHVYLQICFISLSQQLYDVYIPSSLPPDLSTALL